MKNPIHRRPGSGSPRVCILLSLLITGCPLIIVSAPISTLYSTGVSADGAVLPAETADPHYRILRVPDPEDPFLEGIETNAPAFTLRPGFPVGPWIAESAASRWIAPKADQSTGSDPGDYLYQTTFDLTGFDPATAQVSGRWTSDNGGMDLLLNGVSLGITQGGNFDTLNNFEILEGFVEGTNVLEFLIHNAPPGINPTGLRVEIVRAIADKPGDPPGFLAHPTGALALVGDALTLTVELDGTEPIDVLWQRDGANLPGAADTTLTLPSVTLAQAGDYFAIASNAYGTRTSTVARVRVLEPVPGLFSTGIDNGGFAIDDYLVDPHFRLVANPTSGAEEAFVHDSFIFPIVSGPWVANTESSKWIAPEGDTSASLAGDYLYETTFTLPAEFDPATAILFGRWASDNEGLDIIVNGVSTGLRNTAQFSTLTSFEIQQGLVAGLNTVQFKVNNAADGYTALRVDPLRLGALRGSGCQVRIAAQPVGATTFVGASLQLTVIADGCPPLRYQWQHNGLDLSAQTAPALRLTDLKADQTGDYTVTVSDATGASVTSQAARVFVLEPIPGLFNTGVDPAGIVLEDGSVDPHYTLMANPQDPASTNAIVEDSTVFPIVEGPWIANNDSSKWIGPILDPTAAPGEYIYRAAFIIPAEFDLSTVRVQGAWTSDNNATDLLLNGTSTGLSNTGAFGALSPFVITNGFRAGENILEFKISNAGTEANPTGLRVEGMRADGLKGGATSPALAVTRSAARTVEVSWPESAAGFKLYSTSALASPNWTEVIAPVFIVDGRHVVALPAAGTAAFFRLQR